MKRYAGTAVVLGLIGLAATALLLWWLPADDYLFVPDRAKPLAGKVEVQGGRPNAKGDVYYTDLFVRRIRKLEQLLPFTRPDGATFVPAKTLAPDGTTDAERDRQNAEDMQRSEQIAAVVALRALGYQVTATPRGRARHQHLYGRAGRQGARAERRDRRRERRARRHARSAPARDQRSRAGRRRRASPCGAATRSATSPSRRSPIPTDPSRAVIGIFVDQDAKIELPVDVDIDLGRVGGPSAGLPFALEIARQLGRNVTHGCRIAATGALALDGTVLPIGGVKQKTIGARRADVDFFLVPAGENARDARKNADGLRIIPVESFQQALRRLTTSRVKC